MRKYILFTLLSVFLIINSNAQNDNFGIGTVTPNASAKLDIVSLDKGVLIPRLGLSSTTDAMTITNGNIESLLVYNTNTISDVTPGFYYWEGARWVRFAFSIDLSDDQQLTLNSVTNVLILEDGGTVDLTPFLDNTDDQQITAFTLDNATNILTLTLEDGGTKTVDFTTVLAAASTDDQNLKGATLNGSNVLQIDIEDGNSTTVDLSSLTRIIHNYFYY